MAKANITITEENITEIIQPHGYPIENLNEKYKCTRCKYVFKDPYQSNCGHRFCKECIYYILSDSTEVICKYCKDEDSDEEDISIIKGEIHQDFATNRELHKLSIKCSFKECLWSGTYKQYIDHYTNCEFGFIICKTCKMEILKNDTTHITTCFKTCKFGCTDKYTDENEHMQNNLANHMNYLYQYLGMSDDSIKKRDNLLDILYNHVIKQGELIEIFENKKIQSLEQQITIKDAIITDLRLKIHNLDETSYNGTFIWRIDNFKNKKASTISDEPISLFSVPFYSDKVGYKMCGRIFLNGESSVRGLYISLFLVLMKGTYDALLEWPFNKKMSFTLIDQNKKEDIETSFISDPESSSFKRPVKDMNVSTGCPKFCLLTKLNSTENAYVKDDVMFIKIKVY